MQAAVLVIGDEVLAGRTQDTNSRFIAARLAHLGIALGEVRVVGDDATAIQLAAWELAERRGADIVVISGGLGPTHDDRTVAAVAALHAARLVPHAPTLERMMERAERLHKAGERDSADPGPGAQKVALVPNGATVFENPAGAAPGLLLRRRLRTRVGTAWTIALPGVPQELRAVWLAHAEPWLEKRMAKEGGSRGVTRRFECHGQESVLAPHLEAVEKEHKGVRAGSYPGWGTSRIVLTLTGPQQAISAAAQALEQSLGRLGLGVRELAPDEPSHPPNA